MVASEQGNSPNFGAQDVQNFPRVPEITPLVRFEPMPWNNTLKAFLHPNFIQFISSRSISKHIYKRGISTITLLQMYNSVTENSILGLLYVEF